MERFFNDVGGTRKLGVEAKYDLFSSTVVLEGGAGVLLYYLYETLRVLNLPGEFHSKAVVIIKCGSKHCSTQFLLSAVELSTLFSLDSRFSFLLFAGPWSSAARCILSSTLFFQY